MEVKEEEREKSIRDLWYYNKRLNICVIGVPEGEEKDDKFGKVLKKIRAENFPNLPKGINLYIQEAE